jgi:hypothetical protein
MSIYQQHKPEQGDGLYLKLKDGDRVKLRIASEPTGSIYKDGDRLRYSWIVFNREKNKAQVYTAGISVYSAIADLVDEWGEPTDFDIIIKRTGSGLQDTSYSVTPVKKSEDLSDEQLAEVQKIDLPQASKGMWLKEIEESGVMPEPVTKVSGYEKAQATAAKLGGKVTDDFKEEDMPEDWLSA